MTLPVMPFTVNVPDSSAVYVIPPMVIFSPAFNATDIFPSSSMVISLSSSDISSERIISTSAPVSLLPIVTLPPAGTVTLGFPSCKELSTETPLSPVVDTSIPLFPSSNVAFPFVIFTLSPFSTITSLVSEYTARSNSFSDSSQT